MYSSHSILSWSRDTRRVYKLRKSVGSGESVFYGRDINTSKPGKIKVGKNNLSVVLRACNRLSRLQVYIWSNKYTNWLVDCSQYATVPERRVRSEQRIRYRSLKCLRHREPGDIICTYFKLKSVIEEKDHLNQSLICSGRAAESHIKLRNVIHLFKKKCLL